MLVTYLTSMTQEKDPVRRAENLRRYADEARALFPDNRVRMQPQQDGTREGSPDVIHLPPPKDI